MHTKTILKLAMVVALAAAVLFALGAPAALATTGRNGPTIPVVGDDVTSLAEVQIVGISAATGGTFTLTCSAGTTAPIAFNATASSVRSALLLVPCPNVASVSGRTVSPPDKGGPWNVMWRSSGGDIPTLTGDGTALVPSGTVTVTPVQNGAASVAGQIDPHGGYSSTTDYCLQCHQVHNAPNAYSLLAATSVTNVCATCHSLFGLAATGRILPNGGVGFPGTTPGTTSLRSAYDVGTPAAQHQIGSTSIPDSTVTTLTESGYVYGGFSTDLNGKNTAWSSSTASGAGTASASGGGLYCGSCHTPHGEFGQAVNTRWYRSDVASYSFNEVQTVTVGGMTAGNAWTLTYKWPDNTTSTTPLYPAAGYLTSSATASDVQTALAAFLGAGNVSVSGGPVPGTFTVTFQATLGAQNVNPLTGAIQKGAVASPTGTVVVATTKQGDAFNGTHENVHSFQEGAPAFVGAGAAGGVQAYLHLDASPVVWESCPLDPQSAGYALTAVGGAVDTVVNTGNSGSCSYLTATDSEGQTVYLYGYKLLSAYPNHSWAQGPESWGMSNHSHDVARWCGRCHNQAVDSAIDATSTYHNHPTGCTACHGNPNDMTSFDFPHTSTFSKLLKDYPDALCINCHTAGSLP